VLNWEESEQQKSCLAQWQNTNITAIPALYFIIFWPPDGLSAGPLSLPWPRRGLATGPLQSLAGFFSSGKPGPGLISGHWISMS